MAPLGGGASTQLLSQGGDLGFDRAFDINDPCFSSDQFRMYEFKVGPLWSAGAWGTRGWQGFIPAVAHSTTEGWMQYHAPFLPSRHADKALSPCTTTRLDGLSLCSPRYVTRGLGWGVSCPYPWCLECCGVDAASTCGASCAHTLSRPPFSAREKAKRRCPKRYRYSGTACPQFRRVSLGGWCSGMVGASRSPS